MTISQFIHIFRARWKLGLTLLVSVVVAAILFSVLWPKKYTATAEVVIDVRSPDPIQGIQNLALVNPSYMATQIDVLTSDQVARRVVRMARLNESPAFADDWRAATDGKGVFEDWASKILRESLDVRPSRESNVVTVSYRSPDARYSAAMANFFVQAYIEITRELRSEPARQYSGFFESRSAAARKALEQAQERLSAYRQEKGLIDDERYDAESSKLAELSAQLVALQSLSADSSSRQNQARLRSDDLQEVLSNPVVGALKADVARQEARLNELRSRLGERHPEVLQQEATTSNLRRQLELEIARVKSGISVGNAVNKAREAEIRAAYNLQRERVAQLKRERDAAAALVQDVQNAQRAYDALLTRLTQTNLESQNALTNVAVLSEAVEPAEPSSPRLLLNVLLSIIVGTLFAVASMVVGELLDRRIRSGTDIAEGLGVPFLGELSTGGTSMFTRMRLARGRRRPQLALAK